MSASEFRADAEGLALPKPSRADRKRASIDTSELALSKSNLLKDPEYRAWIRTHRCLLARFETRCETYGRGDVEAAHLAHGAGKGLKGSDATCIPLCPSHHGAYDSETLPWQIVAFLWQQALYLREEWWRRQARRQP